MNVELINPFIQGAQSILEMVCSESTKLGKIFLKKAPYSCDEIAVLIGLTGQVKGQVVFNMSKQTACSVASKMMMGMPVPELDDLSRSALSELANMISGNAATFFSNTGKLVDITPPTLTVGAHELDFPLSRVAPIICVPLTFSDGSVFGIDIILSIAA